MMKSIIKELEKVLEGIPEWKIDRCIGQIQSHQRIFVSGAGRTGLMLRAFAMRLMQTGKTAFVAGETTTPAIEPGDLLVAASASGSTQSVCSHVTTALECGADVMVLTAREASPLTQLHPADLVVPAPTKDDPGNQIMGSLFEQAVLLLGDAITVRLRCPTEEMRRRHANLE